MALEEEKCLCKKKLVSFKLLLAKCNMMIAQGKMLRNAARGFIGSILLYSSLAVSSCNKTVNIFH